MRCRSLVGKGPPKGLERSPHHPRRAAEPPRVQRPDGDEGRLNHHDPLLNGLALPTNPKAAAKAGLPRHQVAGSSLVRGHPNLNRDAEALLDALDPFLDDPVRLRAEC